MLLRITTLLLVFTLTLGCSTDSPNDTQIGSKSFLLKNYQQKRVESYKNRFYCDSNVFNKEYKIYIEHGSISTKNQLHLKYEISNYHGIIYKGHYKDVIVCNVPFCEAKKSFDYLSIVIIDEKEGKCYPFSTKDDQEALSKDNQAFVKVKLKPENNKIVIKKHYFK